LGAVYFVVAYLRTSYSFFRSRLFNEIAGLISLSIVLQP